MTEGSMESANQAPATGQRIAGISTLACAVKSTIVAWWDRKRAYPDRLQAIAKIPNAIDQIVDCTEDEKAGSIKNGKESRASMDPTLDSE